MNVTATPAANSTVLLEIELPSERLDHSMDEATRRRIDTLWRELDLEKK